MSTLLQPLDSRPGGGRYLPATPGTVLWGELPCAGDDPVLTIDPGETVVIDTVSHEGILEDQGRDPAAFFASHGITEVLRDAVAVAAEVPHDPAVHGPHVVTGPIRVRGTRPGDVLSMTVLDLRMRADYGIVSSRHGRGALPEEFPLEGAPVTSILARVEPMPDGGARRGGRPALGGPHRSRRHANLGEVGRRLARTSMGSMPVGPGDARRVRFPLAPFLGTMGVAVAGSERAHSVPPGPHGGNVDVSLLTVGSTLHVPVQVDGALAYVGDPHYAQGDGEVALTAFEAPLRASVRFDVIPAAHLPRPGELWAETPDLLVPIGLDPDLNVAMRAAVRSAVVLLTDLGMRPEHAYAYLSAAGDFAVSQVVDRVCGVHGKIRKADLAELA
ncbi:acetamidase/formamidase family protein [Occultella gossypii]|uniref:Acetamidase/formamidase family protein n=1 Tax=Occultella gossypii TaxID=2800820 RepID=A0ABS7SCR5_9MICO|nr:acetamidase/formamidase family protein [Occultella gossypii]MBZ2198152.1 acetamidase/formamidase family protein [Occultella gossypii]